jgi:hypothetical protein
MGFSIRLAPGVRVRASSRGIRTSVGPRAARIHVGGGRTGFSTGVGPVGYYTSVGGSRRRSRSSTGSVNRQLAASARQQAAVDKAGQAQQLAEALQAITEIHREEFPLATRPVAPPPPAPNAEEIRARYREEAKSSTSFFARGARKAALAAADQAATAEVAAMVEQGRVEQARYQAELDRWWGDLEQCEPETVIGTLVAAFEDNEAAATAVGVEGTEVSLVVLVPSESAVPDRRPTLTQAGNLSLKKLTKTEMADFYKLLVAGHMLVTLREAFAVAPALTAARIVAIRASEEDAYGVRKPEVMMAGRCQRDALNGVHWNDADSTRIFNDCLSERVALQKGSTHALVPVPLDSEPDLRALVSVVDLDDLAADRVDATWGSVRW